MGAVVLVKRLSGHQKQLVTVSSTITNLGASRPTSRRRLRAFRRHGAPRCARPHLPMQMGPCRVASKRHRVSTRARSTARRRRRGAALVVLTAIFSGLDALRQPHMHRRGTCYFAFVDAPSAAAAVSRARYDARRRQQQRRLGWCRTRRPPHRRRWRLSPSHRPPRRMATRGALRAQDAPAPPLPRAAFAVWIDGKMRLNAKPGARGDIPGGRGRGRGGGAQPAARHDRPRVRVDTGWLCRQPPGGHPNRPRRTVTRAAKAAAARAAAAGSVAAADAAVTVAEGRARAAREAAAAEEARAAAACALVESQMATYEREQAQQPRQPQRRQQQQEEQQREQQHEPQHTGGAADWHAQTVVVEGALLLLDLRSAATQCFLCRWFNEYMAFGERDQLALSYVLHAAQSPRVRLNLLPRRLHGRLRCEHARATTRRARPRRRSHSASSTAQRAPLWRAAGDGYIDCVRAESINRFSRSHTHCEFHMDCAVCVSRPSALILHLSLSA